MVAHNKTKSLCLVRSSINIDQMFAVPHVVRPGETISSSEMHSRPGGKGANVSAAIGLAGGKIILSGAVGKDAEWPIDELAKRHVQTEKIQVFDDAPTGRAFIQVSKKDGENSIVLLKGANFHPSPKADDPQIVFKSCSDSHSPLTHLVLQNEIPLEITKEFLHYAHSQEQNKCLTIFNPSPMLEDEIVRTFDWNKVDVLIVNEGEGEDLLKALGQSGSSKGDVLDRLANISELQQTSFIVMTKGARGVSAYVDPAGLERNSKPTNRTRIDEPAFKPKQVRDTTGAGDTFAGYLVAGLMRLHDESGVDAKEQDVDAIKTVLRSAIVAAALAVEQDGAMESIPRLETVQKREKEV